MILIADLVDNARRELTALGVLDPNERAFLLAMCRQESSSLALPGYATTLAEKYNNLFGVKWRPSDDGKYGKVTFAANKFDATATVDYRVYISLNRCLEIERVNKILRPQAYAECKVLYGNAYPASGSRPDWPRWIKCISKIHCDENPNEADEIIRLWREFLMSENI